MCSCSYICNQWLWVHMLCSCPPQGQRSNTSMQHDAFKVNWRADQNNKCHAGGMRSANHHHLWSAKCSSVHGDLLESLGFFNFLTDFRLESQCSLHQSAALPPSGSAQHSQPFSYSEDAVQPSAGLLLKERTITSVPPMDVFYHEHVQSALRSVVSN